MSESLNFIESLISSSFGLLLLVSVAISNWFQIGVKTKKNKVIRCMIYLNILALILDPIGYFVDGKIGASYYYMAYASNTLIWICGLFTGLFWVTLLYHHIEGRIPQWHFNILCGAVFFGIAILFLNFFFPLVFTINDQNIYTRKACFYVLIAIQYGFILDGIIIYLVFKIRSGYLKFFPVIQFISPLVVGMLAQSLHYGIATIWPCMAIALTSIMISLNKELMFRDKLTGLYNRFYFDDLKRRLARHKDKQYSFFMLDLNDFKKINDQFGHVIGDEALIDTAYILKDLFGKTGNVIRYAGDEFVIILNYTDSLDPEGIKSKIKEAFSAFNKEKERLYMLSISIGYQQCAIADKDIDDIFHQADKYMYLDKEEYYKENEKYR